MLGATALVYSGLRDVSNIALLLTDNLSLDWHSTSPVSIDLGSGAVITPTIASFANSGATVGAGNRFTACIQTPQSFASGALLRDYSVECAQKATAQIYNIGRSAVLNSAGTGVSVLDRKKSMQGSRGQSFGSGSISFNDGEYLCAVTDSGSLTAAAGNCVLKANWSEMYYPY